MSFNSIQERLCKIGIHDYELYLMESFKFIHLPSSELFVLPEKYKTHNYEKYFARRLWYTKKYVCLCCGKKQDNVKKQLKQVKSMIAKRTYKDNRRDKANEMGRK